MYTPSSFQEKNTETIFEWIESESFGQLISNDSKGIVATHLPFLLNRNAGEQGELIGHIAKANPQWKTANGQDVLAIFTGPHAYISPTWYETPNSVPTWNYVAVHVYGKFEVISDERELVKILDATTLKYESADQSAWEMSKAQPEFIETLLKSIVGFRIRITSIEGKSKLSQNASRERQELVVNALRNKTSENEIHIAQLMEDNLKKSAH